MGSDELLLSGGEGGPAVSSILADPRHRQVLSLLLDRSRPVTERDLSLRVTARETGTEPAEVTEAERRPIRADLYHRCLPKLEAVGLVERHPDGVIAAESLSSWADDWSGPDLRDLDCPLWEAIGALLARPRRRDVVAVIADHPHSISVEELAAELEESDLGPWTDERREGELAPLGTLHHLDLPKLAAVGLIEYDPDENTVARTPTLMTLVDRTDLDDR